MLNYSPLSFPTVLILTVQTSHPITAFFSTAHHAQQHPTTSSLFSPYPEVPIRSLSLPRTESSPYSYLFQADSSRLPGALSSLYTTSFGLCLFPASVPCSFTTTGELKKAHKGQRPQIYVIASMSSNFTKAYNLPKIWPNKKSHSTAALRCSTKQSLHCYCFNHCRNILLPPSPFSARAERLLLGSGINEQTNRPKPPLRQATHAYARQAS